MNTEHMKAVIRKTDPRFATDEVLDALPEVELVDWYKTCIESTGGDDWCFRMENIRANNI
jgi:hypothetical protein